MNTRCLRSLLFTSTLCLSAGLAASPGFAATLPPSTAIPIAFDHTLEAGKAKPGDPVTAKTTQVLVLPDGHKLPRGSRLFGQVEESQAFTFNSTPYATQQPSILSVHFDRIVAKDGTIPVRVSLRALANTLEARDASSPRHTDESDTVGTNVQIGGDTFSPLEREVRSSDGDIVAYNRKQGVFARLQSNSYMSRESSFRCPATDTEQSVGIFSASACGAYGLDTVYIPDNGSDGKGSFSLASRRHTVKLWAGSAALLQVIEDKNAQQAVNIATNQGN
jgi:hypothetical protein